MAEFNLSRGYDIKLDGAAPATRLEAGPASSVAIKPPDFPGLKPKLLVEVGDAVDAGGPLFHEKSNPELLFTSPVSGTVKAIERGARRAITAVVVAPDGKDNAVDFGAVDRKTIAGLEREDCLARLMRAGLLGQFRQRPFDRLPDPAVTPRDIFVSAVDSAPLAANSAMLVGGDEEAFQAGVDVAAKLTTGSVHISVNATDPNVPPALMQAEHATVHRFRGPHPAGNVGVQIHHIKPICGRQDVVWTIPVQGLVLIGRLFLTGRLDPAVTVCVAGSAVKRRGYLRTVLGASIDALYTPPADGEGPVRVISGDVLSGTTVGENGHLGFRDSLVSVIPEVNEPEFIGWMLPGLDKETYWGTFLSYWFGRNRKFVKNTSQNGSKRAFIIAHRYEEVLPMDIIPEPLIKSCLYQDITEMEGLGLYELAPEDLALCEYICPSKFEWQKKIRESLDYVEHEG